MHGPRRAGALCTLVKALAYHDVVPRLREGTDNPRAWLERCLETIAARGPVVNAFVALNESGARAAADASVERGLTPMWISIGG